MDRRDPYSNFWFIFLFSNPVRLHDYDSRYDEWNEVKERGRPR